MRCTLGRMSDVDLAIGQVDVLDIRGVEEIRNLCLVDQGVKHDMNIVRFIDDLFRVMVLAILQVFHGEASPMGAVSHEEVLATGHREPRRGEGGVGDGTVRGVGVWARTKGDTFMS